MLVFVDIPQIYRSLVGAQYSATLRLRIWIPLHIEAYLRPVYSWASKANALGAFEALVRKTYEDERIEKQS